MTLKTYEKYESGAFNRTSMELKPSMLYSAYTVPCTFNRTSMELKLISNRLSNNGDCTEAFNRTSMELKLLMALVCLFLLFLLIEPVWN